jgi:hypothetical protein
MTKKPNAPALPRFIALVGNPKAGKSLVQEMLVQNFGVEPIDSGKPLREIAKQWLGLTHDQVYTQEGKAEYVEILGRRWQVREILGELGNRFEEMFNEHATPYMITRNLGAGPYVDGSCRKGQGRFYQSLGGVVIGIRNPLAPPSPYAFDKVDESIPDYWIENNALANGLCMFDARKDLEQKVNALMLQISQKKAA